MELSSLTPFYDINYFCVDYRKMDDYKEAEWAATSEHDLEALEAHLDGGANGNASRLTDEEG